MQHIIRFITNITIGIAVIFFIKNILNSIDDLAQYIYYIIFMFLVVLSYGLSKYKAIISKLFGSILESISLLIILFLSYIIIGHEINNIIDLIYKEIVGIYTEFINFFEILDKYIEPINNFHRKQFITYFISIYPLLLTIGLLKYYCCKNERRKSLLISDKPIKEPKQDKLGMIDNAKSFAEIVYNNGNNEGFIFGLIAPWGYGKSSFLELFKKEKFLEDKDKKKYSIEDISIIFNFNPWYFEGENDLLNKFLNQFRGKLNNRSKVQNELGLLLKFIEKGTKDLFGFAINTNVNESLEEIKENINQALIKENKKIIIIIDDLDRISDTKLKSIFKIVDLCKDFYNTSFILCYDPSNFNNIEEKLITTKKINSESANIDEITSQEIDNTNLIEYIAKIVNVEYQLIPDYSKLKEYFIETFLNGELRFSENSKKGIKNGIEKLYGIEDFRIWGEYISDVRSIKRLYNHFIAYRNKEIINNELENLFDIEKGIDFSISIKMIILSLKNTNLYKHIIIETKLSYHGDDSLFGFTSIDPNGNLYKLSYNYIYNSESEYKVTEQYKKYIKRLNFKERQLISNIFYPQGTEVVYKGNNIDIKHIGYGKNLERYIDIVETNKDAGFDRFIFDKLEEFKREPGNINIIGKEIYDTFKEKGLFEFKKIIKNDIGEWENRTEIGITWIKYLIDNFHIYSINGLIEALYIEIEIILDRSIPRDNRDIRNYSYIGDFMYGEGIYKEYGGVINGFFNKKWGIIGLYINLGFMYGLYKERSSLYNYTRGIMGNDELNKPNLFYSAKISRFIYKHFKETYIKGNKNIFNEIEKIPNEKFNYEKDVDIFSTRYKDGIIGFIIYQLTAGIGSLDYIDDTSKWSEYEKTANGGIKKELNAYYFEKCFKGKSIKYFINYLAYFINLENDPYELGKINKSYRLKDITDIFEKDRIIETLKSRKKDINKYIKDNQKNIAKITRYSSSTEGDVEIKINYKDFWDYFNNDILNKLTTKNDK